MKICVSIVTKWLDVPTILFCFLIYSCQRGDENSAKEIQPLYADPLWSELKAGSEHQDKSIPARRDTIITGKPVPVNGKVLYANELPKPKIYTIKKPVSIPAYINKRTISGKLKIIAVDEYKLKHHVAGQDKPTTQILNTKGDTVISGVPIDIEERKKISIYPKYIPASRPRMKPDASYDMQCLDLEEGMNSSSITCMLQDKMGNLWFGTYSGGLSKYDGAGFLHFTESNGIANSYVTCMLEDHNGNLWYGTHGGGIGRYDGESFFMIGEGEGASSNYVNCITEDHEGNLWYGTRDNGISCYTPPDTTGIGKIINYTVREGMPWSSVNAILEDKQGFLWIGTNEGLIRFEKPKKITQGTFTYYTAHDGLPENSITSLFEDTQGSLWIGTRNHGLCRFDQRSFTQISSENGLPADEIKCLYGNDERDLWIGIGTGIICRFDGATITSYTEDEGLPGYPVSAFLKDESGNLWIGTRGGGICRFNLNSFIHVNNRERISKLITNCIYEDRNENIWLGTYGNGVLKYRENGVNGDGMMTHYTEKEGLPGNYIMSIGEDKFGNILWGTSGKGLCQVNGNTLTHFTKENGLSGNDIRKILTDQHGGLWLITLDGGITYVEFPDNNHQGFFEHYTMKEGLSGDFARTMIQDHNGIFWIGTVRGGLIRFQHNREKHSGFFTYYTTREGLSDNIINSVIEDRKERLWLGTSNGVMRLEMDKDSLKGKLMIVDVRRGLSSNMVRSLVEDKDGNIWVTTANGLNIIPATAEGTAQRTYSFSLPEGLQGKEFSFNCSWCDRSDRLWFGHEKGLEVLDQSAFNISDAIPYPVMHQLDVNGIQYNFRSVADSLRKEMVDEGVPPFENYPLNPIFAHNKNHLTFHFSAMDWSAPYKIRYSYLIDGLADTWSTPSTETKAEYRNLPFGRHVFKVRAIGESQQWSGATEYPFTIKPPWWLTWWAWLIYGISFISMIHFLYRYQLRRKLQIEENKRLLELDNLKNKLYTNITHEFRTPLTLIHGPLAHALTSHGKLDEKDIQSMYNQSRRLQQLITQMLDLQKIEAGMLKAHYVYGDIVHYVRYLFDAFELLCKEKNITTSFQAIPDVIMMDYDDEKLNQIISNLTSNAIKHTPKHGNVSLRIKAESAQQKLQITVKDSGAGISEDDMPFIFDRFYQASSAAAGGTGIGLALTKNLVELLDGSITVESKLNAGSSFTVTLPIVQNVNKSIPMTVKTGANILFDSFQDEPGLFPMGDAVPAKPVILVVEDHAEVRQYIISCLGDDYNIMSADDGVAGLQKAFELIPDLIISDVMMPRKDGFELCDTLKKDIQTSHIPIILLTGRGDQKALMSGIEYGADAYVVKPFNPDELILRVKKLLELRANLSLHYRQHATTRDLAAVVQASVRENEFLHRMRQFIEEHINDAQFNMEMLCRFMAISHPQLHRKITALTGESTGKFVRSIRLAKAKELLLNSDMTVSEIAYETGFSEPGYFTKVFSKEYNISPTEYRGNPNLLG